MSDQSRWVKTFTAGRQEEIASAHNRGSSGFETCIALTAMMDEAIRTTCESLPGELTRQAKSHIAILALGGYGRVELCPKSDTDIMILCDGGSKNLAESVAKAFLHELWDAGLDIGHSVRTVEEALALHGTSLDVWASLLESRYVCGNKALALSLHSEIQKKVEAQKDHWFIEGVLADVTARHERFGDSIKLLEPNIKKSAGGLRDLQTVFWLYRATDTRFLQETGKAVPASKDFLDILRTSGTIDDAGHVAAVNAIQFLLRTRHEMHYLRQSLHDMLEYALQCEVAEGLGFGPRAEMRSVEVFMREYYLHARTIFSLNRRLGQHFREFIEPARQSQHAGEKTGSCFVLHSDTLSVESGLTQALNAEQIFEAFALAAENDVDVDPKLGGMIERSRYVITGDILSNEQTAGYFRRVLGSRRVAETLRTMNELGVLGKYIPEFGELVAFFQHNVYHYFTADEHTLIAIGNAERLRDEPGIMHEVFRNLRRKDLLYTALLLHDIAKPRGVADHEITGVEMSRVILQRLGMEDIFSDVAFLVRNHLVMEQIAFRRNIHDAATIRDFASQFSKPELLDYLYILTYADLSAVNTNVWTEWKASLLQELYQRTAEVLHRNLRGEQIHAFHQVKRQATVEKVVQRLGKAMPGDEVKRHLEGIQNEAYISVFTDDEISQHIQKSNGVEPVSTLFINQEGYTEVTVIARDAPFALSKFCAVLSANDANIFDANIFTRDDGIVIDRFRVSDVSNKQQLDHRACAKISSDMHTLMTGALDIEHLFDAHRRKWKRRPKLPANPNVRNAVEFEDTPKYTIIDVYSQDSLGLLYRITETISRLGLDIYFAKIATRMDGIVDAFYVLDREGRTVTSPEQREGIRLELLKTIKFVSEQELA